jgi:hypothetical protein
VKLNFNLLEDNFVELVNCLNKYTKNNFLRQAIEALDLIEECAGHLAQRREIVTGFIKSSGMAFYQRDRESMARFPPHYGLEGRKSVGKD